MNSRMVKYTRKSILETQPKFCNILDVDKMNLLIHLFDTETINTPLPKISDYIKEERQIRGLPSNIKVIHKAYGENHNKSTLLLDIKNSNGSLLHLTIHLCVESLNSENAGVLHIARNIYKKRPFNPQKKPLYALITVNQHATKPNSLQFRLKKIFLPKRILKQISKYNKKRMLFFPY